MRETKSSDPEFEEALRKCTELLQKFINRQQQLRLILKKSPVGQYQVNCLSEKSHNTEIIRYIQWIRYHFWGNSDNVIDTKTNNIVKNWRWVYGELQLYSFEIETLKIKKEDLREGRFIWPKDLIECIIKLISPQRSNSIFGGLMNGDYGSINLEHEIGRMRDKINKYDHGPIR